MRRLARHLSALGAGMSGALCIALCVLWVRSYFAADAWYYAVRPAADAGLARVYGLGTSRGGMWFGRTLVPFSPGDEWTVPSHPVHRSDPPTAPATGPGFLGRLGFAVRSDRHQLSEFVALPLWAVLVPAGVWPAVALRRLAKRRAARRRAAHGLCPACGYDLRASPQRCPECGTSPASMVAPSAHAGTPSIRD